MLRQPVVDSRADGYIIGRFACVLISPRPGLRGAYAIVIVDVFSTEPLCTNVRFAYPRSLTLPCALYDKISFAPEQTPHLLSSYDGSSETYTGHMRGEG
jgi:hypothetical protein